jgi:hypothetical protein
MVKVVKKVMFVGRAATFMVGLAVILALTVGVAGAAFGANGAQFILGKTNTVSAITTLVGSVAGPSLQIDNNSTDAAATALDLQVEAGKAPMKVNSSALVANLNADKLDGLTALDFARGVRGIATDADALDGNDSTAFLQSNAEASGDLSGNYANLQINQEAVGSNEVANSSLDIPDVAELHYNFTKDPPSINAGSCATLSETQSVAEGVGTSSS